MSELHKITRTYIKELLKCNSFDTQVFIQGWVRTKRENKHVAFVAINDGSTIHNIQVVIALENISEELLQDITTGAAVAVNGTLVQSMGKGQSVEIQAKEIIVYGTSSVDYPLQKKGHSLEFLREIAHLRPRTNTFGAIFRIRHAMSFAVHKFFNDNNFNYIHTPIITGSDCEGAGQMFTVSTLDLQNIPHVQEGDKNKDVSSTNIDFSQDFFGKQTHLTVSGQLEVETFALALSNVYTFGPTFRAENSNTQRHLAEFWMIEPEVAFNDIYDNIDLAEKFLKYLVQYALDNCLDDLEFLQKYYDDTLCERLQFVIENKFVRITYTEAIDILENASEEFEFPIKWGLDMQSEHERYLVEKHFRKPVVVIDYPKDIKAFYMKQNDDTKTVRAMDVLFPRIGEIIGGSEREVRHDVLQMRMQEMNIPIEHMQWYLDTRQFGSAPHSGFGLGFERLLLFVTGMSNIRDVIPFPRTPKNAEF